MQEIIRQVLEILESEGTKVFWRPAKTDELAQRLAQPEGPQALRRFEYGPIVDLLRSGGDSGEGRTLGIEEVAFRTYTVAIVWEKPRVKMVYIVIG